MSYEIRTGSGARGERKAPSRRWLLGAAGAAVLAAGCSPKKSGDDLSARSAPAGSSKPSEGPSGVLGGNFNGDPRGLEFSQLSALKASWLRGFVPLSDADGNPAGHRSVRKLLDAHGRGYGTVLSLKFPHKTDSLPAVDSDGMKAELARVDKVLQAAMGSVDILVIGNEPFLETQPKEYSRLNPFYRHIAAHVIARRKAKFGEHGGPRLYMGALNHVERGRAPDGTNQYTDQWMEFVRGTPQIDGVDIHPHVKSMEEAATYTGYVLPYLKKHDKSFLATEFSLVNLWTDHASDHVPASVIKDIDLPKRKGGWQVWQVLKHAKENPMPRDNWVAFLKACPWYESNKDYLTRQVNAFRKTGRLAVATYGVRQDDAMVDGITEKKKLWLLNSLYDNKTVAPDKRGRPAHSYAWFDAFRALQRPQDHRQLRTG